MNAAVGDDGQARLAVDRQMSDLSDGQIDLVDSDSVYGVLRAAAVADPQREWLGFIDPSNGDVHWWTYGEFDARVRRLAQGMRQMCGPPGNRVGLMLDNSLAYVECWFAANLAGLISVPLNIELRGSIFTHQLRLTEPSGVIASPQVLASILEAMPPELEGMPIALAPPTTGVPAETAPLIRATEPGASTVKYDTLLCGADDLVEIVSDTRQTCCIMFTSGTTGPSKGVEWTNASLAAATNIVAREMKYSDADIFYATLPLYHGNALITALLPALYCGGKVAVGYKFSPSRFWSEVASTGATVTNLLGAMVPMLLDRPEGPEDRMHSIGRAFVLPCGADDRRVLRDRFGIHAITAYGLTDAGMVMWEPLDREAPPNSCGVPVEEFECAVVDEFDRPVRPDEVGELVVRPKLAWCTPRGYWRMPQETVASWTNLWMHTGDMVTVDANGWYYFRDRRTDSIRRRGENISAYEVETVILRLPEVGECAAYPLPSELGEDEVAIAVVPASGTKEIDVDSLISKLKDQLPRYAVPRYVRVMDALPKTQTEKVQKYVLRADGVVTGDTFDMQSRPAR
jgi:crotonobetaine/carnitine-CoA ligase